MKITATQLRQIIKEEVRNVVETSADRYSTPYGQTLLHSREMQKVPRLKLADVQFLKYIVEDIKSDYDDSMTVQDATGHVASVVRKSFSGVDSEIRNEITDLVMEYITSQISPSTATFRPTLSSVANNINGFIESLGNELGAKSASVACQQVLKGLGMISDAFAG